MSDLNPQRRKVVVLAATVAILSAVAPTLTRNHPRLGMFYVGFMAAVIVYTIVQFGRAYKDRSR